MSTGEPYIQLNGAKNVAGKGETLCTVITYLCLVGFTVCIFVLNLTEWLTSEVTSVVVMIALLVVISGAILAMSWVLVGYLVTGCIGASTTAQAGHVRSFFAVHLLKHQSTSSYEHNFMDATIHFSPLVVFGLCAVLLDVAFQVPPAAYCLSVLAPTEFWSNSPRNITDMLHAVHLHYKLTIGYGSVKGLYILLQMFFLILFAKKTIQMMRRPYLIKIPIVGMLLADFSIFLFTFFRETKGHLRVQETGIDADLLADIPANMSSNIVSCLVGNTTIQHRLLEVTQYFYPFEMEFCLSAFGLIIGLGKTVNVDSNRNNNVHNEISQHSDIQSSNGTERVRSRNNSSCNIIGILLGFLLSAGLSVTEGLLSTLPGLGILLGVYVTKMIHYGSMFVVVVLICIVVGCSNKKTNCSFKVSLGTSKVLLVIAAIGDLIYLFLRLIPAATAFDSDRLDEMIKKPVFEHYTREEVLQQSQLDFSIYFFDILQVLIQTFVILYVSSDKFRWPDSDKYRLILHILLQVLGTSNLLAWINGSFLEFHLIATTPWAVLAYGPDLWTGLAQFTLPMALFYRIHSVHILLKMFIDYRSRLANPPQQIAEHIDTSHSSSNADDG